MESLTIVSPSFDSDHIARFDVGGEIRFGPLYYSLTVDTVSFGKRVFGAAHLWDPSSAFLAVQEWLTLDYSAGPITALVVIDMHSQREITIAQATKRFIIPEAFTESQIVYRIEYAGKIERSDCRIDLATLVAWHKLPGS